MVITECALCGKNYPVLSRVEIEGSIVEVCKRCSEFGKEIAPPVEYKQISRPVKFNHLINETVFVPNYGKLIREALQNKKMNRQEFAKLINESESVLKRVEEESLEPNKSLTKKIESTLGVKLLQAYKEEFRNRETKGKAKLTVGDIIEVR